MIDNRFYDVLPGDLFFINQYEGHHLTQIDSQIHERIVISIHPEFLKKLSCESADLNHCFSSRPKRFGHKISLTEEEKSRFCTIFIRFLLLQGMVNNYWNRRHLWK